MSRPGVVGLLSALAVLAAPAARAQEAEPAAQAEAPAPARPRFQRFSVFVAGSLAVPGTGFRGTRSFTEFAEDSRLDADYSSEPGGAFEAGAQYLFARHVGVALAFGAANRSAKASYTAAMPHPLFLDRDRPVSGERDGLSNRDTFGHLDLVWAGGSGSLGYSLFAGPSYVRVQRDLLDSIQYSHSYPYDTLQVTAVPTRTFDESGVGFNVGGSLSWRLGNRLRAGTLLRFTQARVRYSPTDKDRVEVDGGGFQVGLLLSF